MKACLVAKSLDSLVLQSLAIEWHVDLDATWKFDLYAPLRPLPRLLLQDDVDA